MRLIILGAPGVGKGTQAESLSLNFLIPSICIGSILRQAVLEGTGLASLAKHYMERGEPIPDSLALEINEWHLARPEADKGWILDGFPANLSQAHLLQNLLEETKRSYDRVFLLEAPIEVIRDRLMRRKRSDDVPDLVDRRLRMYFERSASLVTFYARDERLVRINASQSRADVDAEIHNSIASIGMQD